MPPSAAPGRPTGLDPAFGSYRPPTGEEVEAPIPVLIDAWYATYPDPSIESIYRAGLTVAVERVFGDDSRERVNDTRIDPYRWVAMLEITASDGSRWRGTGWL